jgi:hypothetical protein
MTRAGEHGVRLCSACSGDYEDPDALSPEEESATENEEESGE